VNYLIGQFPQGIPKLNQCSQEKARHAGDVPGQSLEEAGTVDPTQLCRETATSGRVLAPRKPCKCQAIGARPTLQGDLMAAGRAGRRRGGCQRPAKSKAVGPEGSQGRPSRQMPTSRRRGTDGTIWVGKTRLHDAGTPPRCRCHVRTAPALPPCRGRSDRHVDDFPKRIIHVGACPPLC
jgi:hypothetical protein